MFKLTVSQPLGVGMTVIGSLDGGLGSFIKFCILLVSSTNSLLCSSLLSYLFVVCSFSVLPFLNVIAKHYSLPSFLGLTSDVLGKLPCGHFDSIYVISLT